MKLPVHIFVYVTGGLLLVWLYDIVVKYVLCINKAFCSA